MGALLAVAGKAAAGLIGRHLVRNHVAGAAGRTWETLAPLAGGLGMRFALGALSALYATNPDARHGIDCAVKGIAKAILPW